MASLIPIVTLAQAKTYLGLPNEFDDSDELLDTASTGWIDIVSGVIERYLGTKVCAQAVTAYLNGDGTNELRLPESPIISATSIQHRTTYNGTFTDLFTSSDEYFTDPLIDAFRIVAHTQCFPVGVRNIKVVYQCGWSSIPADIQKVALEMLLKMWNESKKGLSQLGKSSVNVSAAGSSGSESLIELEPRWMKVLDRYRQVRV